MDDYLEFEQPLADLDEKISQLQQQNETTDRSDSRNVRQPDALANRASGSA